MVWHAWKELHLEAEGHGQLVGLLTVNLSPVLATEGSTLYEHLQGAFEPSELSPVHFYKYCTRNSDIELSRLIVC